MSWTRKMSWSTEEEPNAHRKRKKKLNQNLVYHSADEDEVVAGSFLEGCPTFLEFWDLFDNVFADFQEQTYQLFSLRTSASMKARNRKIASEQAKAKKNAVSWKAGRNSDKRSRTGGTLLPEAWDTYCRTFLCTYGMPFVSKGTGRRSHSKVRSTGCSARVNARVCLRPSGNGFHLVASASGAHDHALTEHQWYSYAENRRIEDPQLREDVAVLSKAGAKPRGILSYLRAKTDVHNLIHVVKKTFRGGRTDAERAESQEEYGDLKDSLLETLGNDKENRLYMSFMQHWDTTTDEWVMFKHGDVPHLMNNTNNRLESKWGRIKEVMDTHMTIDELLSMLITLQGYAEERYLSEWHRVGSRVQINEDRELKSIRQLSTYAFRIVSDQYKLAVGPQANYSIDMDCEKTRLTNPATGKAHEVDPRGVLIQLATCDCIFSQTCLLPCRHVMYVRSKANFETVIPPLHTFSS
ncbi:hypothetical protein F443_10983 [Phytophthora nicotianae P1569]|uniref:SWIM-type domain-containing protein n=1 Tax=Phytophthora nicotianae P1569 TaxID=1317065 RepID=V9EYF3_PHYNI|nr:hypothetical protein F443_10983 [Phytophthora nicotianae P1569]